MNSSENSSPPSKTWKREMALVLFIWLAYVVETKDVELTEILVWPIFTFAGLAFGLEYYGKSGGLQQSVTRATGRGRT